MRDQTLEEKRELLWKAVHGEVELEWLDPNDKKDKWIYLELLNAVGKKIFFAGGTDFEIDDFIFRIAEPRKTDKQWADDLAEAIGDLASRLHGKPEYKLVKGPYRLAKRYREQESK